MGVPESTIVIVVAMSLALVVYPAGRICARLGFPASLGLLAVVPVVNLLFLWFVASTAWPIEQQGLNHRGDR